MLAIAPLRFILNETDQAPIKTLTLGVSILESTVTDETKDIEFFDKNIIVQWVILGAALILNFLIAVIAVYYTAHNIIRPLRFLNIKLKMIL